MYDGVMDSPDNRGFFFYCNLIIIIPIIIIIIIITISKCCKALSIHVHTPHRVQDKALNRGQRVMRDRTSEQTRTRKSFETILLQLINEIPQPHSGQRLDTAPGLSSGSTALKPADGERYRRLSSIY